MMDIEAINERVTRATPGPWWVQGPVKTHDGAYRDAFVAFGTQGDLSDTFDLMERYDVDTDYQFIAHARTDIPALLTEVVRIEAAAQSMRAALAACADALEAHARSEYDGTIYFDDEMDRVERARAAMALFDEGEG